MATYYPVDEEKKEIFPENKVFSIGELYRLLGSAIQITSLEHTMVFVQDQRTGEEQNRSITVGMANDITQALCDEPGLHYDTLDILKGPVLICSYKECGLEELEEKSRFLISEEE